MSELLSLLFSPDGRMNRLEYFAYCILVSIALFAIGVGLVAVLNEDAAAVMVVFLLFVYFYIMITFDIKRLHDMGYPGWHMVWIIGLGLLASSVDESYESLRLCLGIINLVISLVMLLTPGTKGQNEFGQQK